MSKKPSAVAADELVAVLSELGNVTQRKIFGGVGIFCSDKMYALINSAGTAYLKTDETVAAKFEKLGAAKFGGMNYHEVPDVVYNDRRKLLDWARASLEIARSAKKKK